MTWLVSLIDIRWILIYPVGSAIQRLNKRGLIPIHWFTTMFLFFSVLRFLILLDKDKKPRRQRSKCIPTQINEVSPHFIRKIKWKGYDIIVNASPPPPPTP